MEQAPLPPHERSWRHPSEVGPTRLDVDGDGSGPPILLAVGTLAAAALIVMVVAFTPRGSDAPLAVSATTTPAASAPVGARAATPQVLTADPAAKLASFVPIPNEIAARPGAQQGTVRRAEALPDPDEIVHVQTDRVTYRVAWADVVYLHLDEVAIVFDHDGRLVARIAGEYVEVLVEN